MELERRFVTTADAAINVEERAGAAPRLRGISPPWNSMSVNLGSEEQPIYEQFDPGAFDHIVGRHRNDPRGSVDVLGLFNHDENQVLSRTTSGTLQLEKADRGLAYSMDLPETTLARDLAVLVRRGDIAGSSFAFSIRGGDAGQSWERRADGAMIRTVKAADLYDVSVVTRPAYPASTAALRSLERWRSEHLTDAERNEIAERAADAAADAARRTRITAAAAIAKARHGLL